MIITQKKSLRIWSTLKVLWIRRCSRNEFSLYFQNYVRYLNENFREVRKIYETGFRGKFMRVNLFYKVPHKAVVGGTAGPAMAGPLFWPKMVLAGPLFWPIMIFFAGSFFPADLDFLIR